MKEHMAITIAAQKAYRKGVLARLKEQGLGVGAVVTLQGAMTTDDGQTAMPLVVTRINWNDINTWRTEADIHGLLFSLRLDAHGISTFGPSLSQRRYS
jgi:hypothetical protein